MIFVEIVLWVAGTYLTCYVAYWFLLLLAHFSYFRRVRVPGRQATRFAILIPAHDEELLLGRLLSSLREQDYPEARCDPVVIADNCTDGTAQVAREHSATVLERTHATKRGKGYAIQWALEKIDLDRYDAVLVVDADCFLSPNALASLDSTLQVEKVAQCYSGVGNPEESWFTRLLDVSRTINNNIYSPAKRRLGLSVQLIGTGMCFSTDILRRFGWDAFTVGEDYEYFAKLIQHGQAVGFDWDAKVFHQESTSLKQATTQRMRWSSGRLATLRSYGLPLMWQGITRRDAGAFDAGLALLFPNPSLGMNLTLVCGAAAVAVEWGHPGYLTAWFLALALGQLLVFLAGVMYTRNRLKKFLSIFVAPVFLAWKLGIDALAIAGVGRKNWVRTERKL